jgi:regulator of RNase E activity RraA
MHDQMRAMGLKDFAPPPNSHPISPERAMVGPALTILGKVDKAAGAHDTLLAWTGLLSKAPSGSIWVCQPNEREVAHMGGLSGETLKNKGVRGCVDDGCIRDVNFLLAMGSRPGARATRRETSSVTGCRRRPMSM